MEVEFEGYLLVDYEGLCQMLMEGVQATHYSGHTGKYEPFHLAVEVSISTGENYVILFLFRLTHS